MELSNAAQHEAGAAAELERREQHATQLLVVERVDVARLGRELAAGDLLRAQALEVLEAGPEDGPSAAEPRGQVIRECGGRDRIATVHREDRAAVRVVLEELGAEAIEQVAPGDRHGRHVSMVARPIVAR